MDYRQIKKIFLDYFVKNDHFLINEVSLIPKEEDPSALFISSGMHPLKNYFLGIEKPPSKRLCSNQRCIRTVDIDEVGYNISKLTFFFMLGNWSIGDYWKEEALKLAYDLIVNGYKIPKERLWVTVFAGDENVPADKESVQAWKKIGIPDERIVRLPFEDNFWASGPTGPCGPCTEVFYDRGPSSGCGKKTCNPGCKCGRFIEIWNVGVFMQYNRKEDGRLENLPIKSVDTGAGIERMAQVMQKKDSVFETDMFLPVLKMIEAFSKKRYGFDEETTRAMRIILDHSRAIVFAISDGVTYSKIGRGYVLRRLTRRLIKYANQLGLNKEQTTSLLNENINLYQDEYPNLRNKKVIIGTFSSEYDKFIITLQKGIRRLNTLIETLEKSKKKVIDGVDVFHLYDTYGFPLELTKEIAAENGLGIDEQGYKKAFEAHKKISKRSATKKFKGGLLDASYESAKLHTATHLLHQALRDVLGKHVMQKGSNITPERLRFDFSYDKKMSEQEIKRVENIVNEKIKQGLEVKREDMMLEEARKKGAIALFEGRYDEKVSVYSINNYSKEVCMGPHVKNTSELGHFKIMKEEAVAAGIRRIRAVLE